MNCVLRQWVTDNCTLKMQSVLICAMRGCDGLPKENPTKTLTRAMRGVVLRSAVPGGSDFNSDRLSYNSFLNLTENLDPYPFHWVMHTIHAVEIIGYFHNDAGTRNLWYNRYLLFCSALHFGHETEAELCERLKDS